jgi:hypothetical protein
MKSVSALSGGDNSGPHVRASHLAIGELESWDVLQRDSA